MLIVTGIFEVDKADAQAVRAAAIEMMHETRNEPGCLVYEFAQVLDSETRFRVYEEWDSEAALDAHFRTPHMARFREALGGLSIKLREIYTVSGGVRAPL